MYLNGLSRNGYRVSRIVLSAVTTALVILILLAVLRIGLVYWLYSTAEDWVTVRLGLDYYTAQLATTIFVSIFAAFLPTLAWYVLIGRKRLWGAVAMIGGQAMICLLVYTVGCNVCFDRRTGAPLCYYADTLKGRVWSYTPGFDPESGQPFKLYTREIKDKEDAQHRKQTEENEIRQKEEQSRRDAISRQQQAELQEREEAASRREEVERKKQEIARQEQQIAQQKLADDAQRQRERDQKERDAEDRRQQELERQKQAGEAQRLQQIEQRRRDEEIRREEELEHRRQVDQQRRQREAEERDREAEARRQREDERRRKDARNRAILDLINKTVERVARPRY